MNRIGRVFVTVLSLQFLLISDATISFSQVDPTKALIGTWEGQIEITGNSGWDRIRMARPYLVHI